MKLPLGKPGEMQGKSVQWEVNTFIASELRGLPRLNILNYSECHSGHCLISPSLNPSLPSSSVAVCRFPNGGDDWYVLVGVARDMILNPRSVAGGYIYTYRLAGGGEKLEFVHKVSSRGNNFTASWSRLSVGKE